MGDPGKLAWSIFKELRKELVEAQRIRTQLIGFKITIVGTGIGLIVANQPTVNLALLAVPAAAAVFFDLLIVGYNVSVLRIGFYCLTHLEPILRGTRRWPARALLWEEFMHQPRLRGVRPALANLGLSAIAIGLGVFAAMSTLRRGYGVSCSVVLIGLFIVDCLAHLRRHPLLRRTPQQGVAEEIEEGRGREATSLDSARPTDPVNLTQGRPK